MSFNSGIGIPVAELTRRFKSLLRSDSSTLTCITAPALPQGPLCTIFRRDEEHKRGARVSPKVTFKSTLRHRARTRASKLYGNRTHLNFCHRHLASVSVVTRAASNYASHLTLGTLVTVSAFQQVPTRASPHLDACMPRALSRIASTHQRALHSLRARAVAHASVASRRGAHSRVMTKAHAHSAVTSTDANWVPLRDMHADELRLKYTLPTGQSFRWRPRGSSESDYVGVIGARVVRVRETVNGDAEYKVYCRPASESDDDDDRVVRDYFNADVSLVDMHAGFAANDARFRALAPYVGGSRMLRQDASECLFSFICSSNNHISRIHGMVEKMCVHYGDVLPVTAADVAIDDVDEKIEPEEAAAVKGDEAFYTFPSVSQILAKATEERLRELGFGYRAKFIVGAAKVLAENPDGKSPEAYLASLRDEKTYAEAHEALMACPGIGPKVSACACLFSLDKHEAIPVDTHVWQFAVEHYMPELREAKSVTPKIMRAVEDKMFDIFGPYAGWAHNAMFIAELKSIKESLPEELRTPRRATPGSASKAAKKLKIKDEPKPPETLPPAEDFGSPARTRA